MVVFHLFVAAPGTAGIWHFIRSGPGPELWFHSEKRHSRLQCVHLAICQHLFRKQQQWLHSQRTTGIIGNQISGKVLGFLSEETLCPTTLGLFQDPRGGYKASSHLQGKLSLIRKCKVKKPRWIIQEVKYSKWQADMDIWHYLCGTHWNGFVAKENITLTEIFS